MMTVGDACYDLKSAENFYVEPGESHIVPLGVAFQIPNHLVGIITHRSSLAFKRDCICSYGVIDSSFDDDVFAKIFNLGEETQFFEFGERIVQIKFEHVEPVSLFESEWITGGKEGFGSSGRM